MPMFYDIIMPMIAQHYWTRFLSLLLKRIDQLTKSSNEYYLKQWTEEECEIMNQIDFRYWHCECHYQPPYGFVAMGGCKYHD